MSTTDDLTFTKEEYVDKTVPEDKIVQARLDEIKPDSYTYEGKEVKQIVWWWVVVSPEEYAGRKIKGKCNAQLSAHPKNRLNNWITAIRGGQEIPVGANIRLQDFVGLQASLTVRHRPDKKDPSVVYEEVDEVIPITEFDKPPF